MNRIRSSAMALTGVAVIGSVAGLATSATAAPTHSHPVTVAHSSRQTIGTRKTRIGTILVDSSGHTVYLFKKDEKNKSRCFGNCASTWPPVMTSSKPAVKGGAESSKVGIIKRGSSYQVTYAGHPLYTYVSDSSAGDVYGNDVSQYGAKWYALTSSGKQK